MRLSALVGLLFSLVTVTALNVHPRSIINGKCTGKDGESGVCISKTSCSDDGGSWINDACPGLPEDIKCCTKASCQKAERTGACRWSDKCGTGYDMLTGLCPGPSGFRCCVSKLDTTKSEQAGAVNQEQESTPEPKDETTMKQDPGTDVGKKILKKAMEAKGKECK
jgi:hypothetical protein